MILTICVFQFSCFSRIRHRYLALLENGMSSPRIGGILTSLHFSGERCYYMCLEYNLSGLFLHYYCTSTSVEQHPLWPPHVYLSHIFQYHMCRRWAMTPFLFNRSCNSSTTRDRSSSYYFLVLAAKASSAKLARI